MWTVVLTGQRANLDIATHMIIFARMANRMWTGAPAIQNASRERVFRPEMLRCARTDRSVPLVKTAMIVNPGIATMF